MLHTILIQAIGMIAVVCYILSFQIKSNKALFICQTTGSAVFCIQYLLLGALTGSINYLAAMIRNLMLSKMDKYPILRWKGWAYIYSAIAIIIMIITWQGPASILPTLAFVVASFALLTDNAQKIRFYNLICISPAYLAYGIYAGSIGAILNETFILASIIISIYRYGWKAMGENNFEKEK